MARGNRANREVRVGRRELRKQKEEGRSFGEKFMEQRKALVAHVEPKTVNQKFFLDALKDQQIVIGMGSAGTGKTFLAATHATNEYIRDSRKKIYIARPYIPMGNSVGLLPGEIEDKIMPFLAPLTSVMKAQLGPKFEADFGKNIQIQLVEAIRGLDLQNAILIVDEAQNLTIEEVKSIATRIGENSQIILIGDSAQSDLPDGESGLPWLIDLAADYDIEGIDFVEFTSDDIVRSGLVKRLVKAFEAEAINRRSKK